MDGNNYNNNNQNGSSDSFYSYNNGSQSNQQTEHANEGNVNQHNNSYQNTNSYSQNAGYQQGSAYQNGTYQNTGYQQNDAYQNGGYQNTNGAFYQNAQTTGKKQKKKRERKPGGFGTKLAKCAAIALDWYQALHLRVYILYRPRHLAMMKPQYQTAAVRMH